MAEASRIPGWPNRAVGVASSPPASAPNKPPSVVTVTTFFRVRGQALVKIRVVTCLSTKLRRPHPEAVRDEAFRVSNRMERAVRSGSWRTGPMGPGCSGRITASSTSRAASCAPRIVAFMIDMLEVTSAACRDAAMRAMDSRSSDAMARSTRPGLLRAKPPRRRRRGTPRSRRRSAWQPTDDLAELVLSACQRGVEFDLSDAVMRSPCGGSPLVRPEQRVGQFSALAWSGVSPAWITGHAGLSRAAPAAPVSCGRCWPGCRRQSVAVGDGDHHQGTTIGDSALDQFGDHGQRGLAGGQQQVRVELGGHGRQHGTQRRLLADEAQVDRLPGDDARLHPDRRHQVVQGRQGDRLPAEDGGASRGCRVLLAAAPRRRLVPLVRDRVEGDVAEPPRDHSRAQQPLPAARLFLYSWPFGMSVPTGRR